MSDRPEISRAPGNVDNESYEHLLKLALQNPRGAMEFAAGLLGYGDGSNYAAIACNMIAVIAYARRLETSEAERDFAFALPVWEDHPPTTSAPLFVSFRLRYSAGRTKTAAYERARVHCSAISPAYHAGIQLHQIRSYIEEHGIENLYSRSQRPVDSITERGEPDPPGYPSGKQVLPDLSGQSEHPAPGHGRCDEGDDEDDNHPLPRLPSPPSTGGSPPNGKPPKTPKYVGVTPAYFIEVGVSKEDFDDALDGREPEEFTLHCRRTPNGPSKWVRIDGNIL